MFAIKIQRVTTCGRYYHRAVLVFSASLVKVCFEVGHGHFLLFPRNIKLIQLNIFFFDVLLTVHLSIILAINQLNSQNLLL